MSKSWLPLARSSTGWLRLLPGVGFFGGVALIVVAAKVVRVLYAVAFAPPLSFGVAAAGGAARSLFPDRDAPSARLDDPRADCGADGAASRDS